MEFLVTMTTRVPDGTSEQAVADIRAREAARARELAAQGHLLRLWRPPLQPGEWRTLGLFSAADAGQLEEVLASMPLRVWRTDEVTPLSPHPSDPAQGPQGAPTTSGGTREPLILDATELTSDPDLAARFAESAHKILTDLVRAGAALGWVEPPSRDEVSKLLDHVVSAANAGDAALRAAYLDRQLVGLGYWLRYARPTHRPHADLEKIAVDAAAHGHGIGRALTAALITDARRAGIEVLTLDARGDNGNALHLYRSLGFSEYGRLPDFVAVGTCRYDKVLYMLDFRQEEGCAS